jgi:hypothetical protein
MFWRNNQQLETSGSLLGPSASWILDFTTRDNKPSTYKSNRKRVRAFSFSNRLNDIISLLSDKRPNETDLKKLNSGIILS